MSFLGEIKRRKVFQVTAVYAVVAWLLIQIAGTIEEPLSLPAWFDTVVIVLLAMGFPIALILSWAFDLTPSGVVRTPRLTTGTARGSRALEYALLGLIVVAIGWILYRVEWSRDSMAGSEATEISRPAGGDDSAPALNSVAMLPWENPGGTAEDAYFIEGLQSAVIDNLSRVPSLDVRSISSVTRLMQSDATVDELAAALNVAYLVEGSLVRSADVVRIDVRLVDTQSGRVVWTDSLDRHLADANLLNAQADVARLVAEAIGSELTPEDLGALHPSAVADYRAWSNYMEGVARIASSQVAEQILGRDLLAESVRLDPSFVRAQVALARAHMRLVGYFGETPEEGLSAAQAAIDAALASDPELPEAHAAQADLFVRQARFAEAEAAFAHAIELAPDNADLRNSYAGYHLAIGDLTSALSEAERAVDLDPYSPGAHSRHAEVLMALGEHAAAQAAAQRAVDLDPQSFGALNNLAFAYLWQGQSERATQWAEALLTAAPGDLDALAIRAIVAVVTGDRARAEEIVKQLEMEGSESWGPTQAGLVNGWLGDMPLAYQYLRRAQLEARPSLLNTIRVNATPTWRPFQNDPRFERLLRELGLR